MRLKHGPSTISVEVQLAGAQPNMTYDVELLQAGACGDPKAQEIHTNSYGSGSVEFSEPAAGPTGQDRLIVAVGQVVEVSSGGGPTGSGFSRSYLSPVLHV